ncbi:MAG: HD domain-containing protein [Methanosarcinales archaeon]|nr:HD domain-containing protein [Methanosarcinales archaeon]
MQYKQDQILRSVNSILENKAQAGHDINHTLRVKDLCLYIAGIEGGDVEVLEACALLHDIGRPEEIKNPGTDHAFISAQMAPGILKAAGFPAHKVESVIYSITNHRYSSKITPTSLEARILQDADRLDITGAVGIAMTFAYSGAYGHMLYHPDDPMCKKHKPDDNKYAMDHILSKLIQLPTSMHTNTARHIANKRNKFLLDFIDQFKQEITFVREREL